VGLYGSSDKFVDPRAKRPEIKVCHHCGVLKTSEESVKRCWKCGKYYKKVGRLKFVILAVGLVCSVVFIHLNFDGIVEEVYDINEMVAIDSIYDIDLSTANIWAHESIINAVYLGIVPNSEYSDYSMFVTRAEFAAFVVTFYEVVLAKPIMGHVSFFDTSDVNVQKVAYIGIMNGIDENNFSPDEFITREQVAVVLSRLSYAVGVPLLFGSVTFDDGEYISYQAVHAVGQMQMAGIMGGVGYNMFAPHRFFSYEQTIVAMLRLYENVLTFFE